MFCLSMVIACVCADDATLDKYKQYHAKMTTAHEKRRNLSMAAAAKAFGAVVARESKKLKKDDPDAALVSALAEQLKKVVTGEIKADELYKERTMIRSTPIPAAFPASSVA